MEGIAGTLFQEIAHDADEIWKKVYAGKSSVTHKALSPLRSLREKLMGLTFVEPHVAPVADLVDTALTRTQRKGNIMGADLLMLQGLVCLLREPDTLVMHAHKLLEGRIAGDVLDGILSGETENRTEIAEPASDIPEREGITDGDCPLLLTDIGTDSEGDSPRLVPKASISS